MKKKFTFYFWVSEVLYLLFYFLKWLSRIWGVEKLSLKDNRMFALTTAIYFLLFIFYVLGFRLIKLEKVSFKNILLTSVIFAVSLLFVRNIASNDFNTYIFRGRLMAQYHANPYFVPYDRFSSDLFYSKLKTYWSRATAIYGPVAMLFGGVVSAIAKNSLFWNVFIFKFIFSALSIASGVLIYKITKSKRAAYLYLWNPLIAFEILLNAHIDILMLFFFVLSIYFLLQKQTVKNQLLSWVFGVVSVLTKFLTAVPLAFSFVYSLKRVKRISQKGVYIIGAFITGFIITTASYIPFWEGPQIFDRLLNVARAKSLEESVGILLFSKIFSSLGFANAYNLSRQGNNIIFLLVFVFLFLSVFFAKKLDKNGYLFNIVFLFSLLIFMPLSLVLPWYLTTLIALACIYYGIAGRGKPLYIYLLSIYSFLLYFVMR